ncbi:hypothetical protein Gohar_000966 [Gossypium harknessii]|uniref:Uncharacterized protein n=1 Tax=Gossypium harknessii TaxID=34285 RepID=A0A7J9I2D1_9ROSI|nr:hypothetical protein [Gossypium harknessii]
MMRKHPSPSVLIPALRTVGNMCTIENQAFPCLLNILANNFKKSINKEACWAASNITARNKEQIQVVIEANIIAPLVHLLQNAEFDIKKEAVWAISNATSGGTPDQIKYEIVSYLSCLESYLASQGCIKPLFDLLNCPDPRIVTVYLVGLENILKVGKADKNLGSTRGVNLHAQMTDDTGAYRRLRFYSVMITQIYEKAVKILETYWLVEEDETMPPGDASQTGFQFCGGELPVPSGGFNFN